MTQKDISAQMLLVLEFLEHLLKAFPEFQTQGKCDSTAAIQMLETYTLDARKIKIGGILR